MRLLLDEMLSSEIAAQMRSRGHDVLAVTERGDLRGAPDQEVFARAQAERRALVTYNRGDYLRIATEYVEGGGSHTGLIIVHPHRFPEGASRTHGRMVKALDAFLRAGASYPSFVHWLQ